MDLKRRTEIVLTDFSGVYRQEEFWRGRDVSWIDFSGLSGTNCYCDGEAAEKIRKEIAPFSGTGIHFLDSGNYHYMSRFWMEKIQEPFRLLVFDNHTDMQLPAFGGLLSCGGWVAAALDELEFLKEVILAGPDEEAFSQTEKRYRSRVRLLSRERLAELRKSGAVSKAEILQKFPADLPVYLSVDKDVCKRPWANTSWSQGDMDIDELAGCLNTVISRLRGEKCRLLGVDICGEADASDGSGNRENDHANARLLSEIMESFFYLT